LRLIFLCADFIVLVSEIAEQSLHLCKLLGKIILALQVALVLIGKVSDLDLELLFGIECGSTRLAF
jgi:hypothetical protein